MKRLSVALLVIVTGGWMAFDGAHALITGDFVTPGSGEHAGQLGPWAGLLEAAGIAPRSFGVKVFFLLFGLAYLGALWAFLLRRRGSRLALTICAAVALLYVPFGTIASLIILAIVITHEPEATRGFRVPSCGPGT